MRFTHFTLSQDGQHIGSVAVREQAVNAARSRASDTGRPVSIVAHIDDGRTCEVIFTPEGTNEKIWAIDKGQPLVPTVGQVYVNRGGGEYRCIAQMTVHNTIKEIMITFDDVQAQ